MNKTKVCIRCATFNHSRYIEDAMNGFVMQETDFPFVAVIVDDASIDGEPQVLRDYYFRYFNYEYLAVAYQEETEYGTILFAQHRGNKNCCFAIVLLKENHYSRKKSKLPYYSRWSDKAEYIALCEGDDYWTDPYKLQKQVDYMDSHPDCMLCVHSANWQTEDKIYLGGCQVVESKDFSIEELIRCGGLYFATASFLFRPGLDNDWPKWRLMANVGDFPLQILAGLRGNVHYLADRMCVYRYLSRGSWSFNQQKIEANVAFQKNKIGWMTILDEDTSHEYKKVIYDQLFLHFNSLYNLGEIGLVDYVKATYRSGRKRFGRLCKDALRIELSPVYRLLAFLIDPSKRKYV